MRNPLLKIRDFFDRILPKDGRWFLGGSHFTLLLVAIPFLGMHRSWFHILTAYGVAIATEMILFSMTKKYKGRPVFDRVFSAASEAAGLLILVRPGQWHYIYCFSSFTAVASKYIFRLDEKRHVFNPTCFAIVLNLVVLPYEWLFLVPDEYSRNFYAMFHVTIFGIIATWRANRWRISLGYQAACLVLSAFMVSISTNEAQNFIYWWGPEVGAYSLIFTWLMITDPRTTPGAAKAQWIFGVIIAAAVFFLRWNEILYPRYVALFFMNGMRALAFAWAMFHPKVRWKWLVE